MIKLIYRNKKISEEKCRQSTDGFIILFSILLFQSFITAIIVSKLSIDIIPLFLIFITYTAINLVYVFVYVAINKVLQLEISCRHTVIFGVVLAAVITIENILYYLRIGHINSSMIYSAYALLFIMHLSICFIKKYTCSRYNSIL